MTARRVVVPGSYDPITLGHLDLIERATALFDTVVVAIGANVSKKGRFSVEERLELATQACADLNRVEVVSFTGLLVDFCVGNGISAAVKGVRGGADTDYESAMAQMNRRLGGVDTVLLISAPQWSYVSSSLVREIAGHGGDVTPFVPPMVAERLAKPNGSITV